MIRFDVGNLLFFFFVVVAKMDSLMGESIQKFLLRNIQPKIDSFYGNFDILFY